MEILCHRVVWSLVFFVILLGLRDPARLSWRRRSGKVWRVYWLSGGLIAVNWLTFIWAVTTGHVLQASLGYFLSPLASVAIGALFFAETLSRRQQVAVACAAGGAITLLFQASAELWIALLLTLTFCLYGVARRLAPLPSLEGMYLETLLLTPLALLYFGWAWAHHQFLMPTARLATQVLMLGAGPVTGIPLLLFSEAAQRLPLSRLGMFQYLSPSLHFALAVGFYHEPFHRAQATAFGLTWLGLLLYTHPRRATRAPREGQGTGPMSEP